VQGISFTVEWKSTHCTHRLTGDFLTAIESRAHPMYVQWNYQLRLILMLIIT